MIKPKLKEHLYREMVNDLKKFAWSCYAYGRISKKNKSFDSIRNAVLKIVSKYIEAGE